jgi:predicted nucleotidyltransferase
MGDRRALVEQHRDEIAAAVRRHRGRAVALFGSAARGDDHEGSDVDLLVDFEPDSSLFDLLHLQDELEQLSASLSTWCRAAASSPGTSGSAARPSVCDPIRRRTDRRHPGAATELAAVVARGRSAFDDDPILPSHR